jgi:hypothetical protein
MLALVPERGFAVAVLTNSESSDDLLDEATAWAIERYLGLRRPVVPEVPLAPERLAGYAGAYEAPDGRGGSVDARGGGLLLTRTRDGQPAPGEPVALTPIGGDGFVSRGAGRESFVDFERDEAGAVGWIRLGGRLVPRVA